MNSHSCQRSGSRLMCGGLLFSLMAVSAVRAEEVARTIAAYTNANGYLEYTAEAPNETVSFDGGAPIVWGTSFPQNRANFNPQSATDILTVVNPLVVGGQDSGSRINVAQGTTVFTGALTSGDRTREFALKLGGGTAKFVTPVSLAVPYKSQGGTSVFCKVNGEHTLFDLCLDTYKNALSSVVVFDETGVQCTSGYHIGCEAGKLGKSFLYASNSTVRTALNVVDMNVGHNGASADYEMYRGSLNVGKNLLIGRYPGSTALLKNTGGEMTVNGSLYLASDDMLAGGGRGTLRLDVAGALEVGKEAYLGVTKDGSATLVVDGSGSMTVGQKAYFGLKEGSAQLEVDGGGSLTVAGTAYWGYDKGSARLDVRRGTVKSQFANIGYSEKEGGLTKGRVKIGEGGSFASTGQVIFGYQKNNLGCLEMTGGSFSSGSLALGRYGVFHGTMTGGDFTATGAEFYFGRYKGGVGRMDMYGGRFSANLSGVKAIGGSASWVAGGTATGIVSVAKSAVFSAPQGIDLALGSGADATSYGEINLAEGGVFETTKIGSSAVYGTRRITADGGTFRVLGNGAAVTYLDNVNLSTYVGRRGVAFDTGNNTATVKAIAADGRSPGQIRKVGTGTLVFDVLPQTHGGVSVREGTLKLSSGATVGKAYTPEAELQDQGGNSYPAEASAELVGANYLLHRWSFTGGSLYDSVGVRRAAAHGDMTIDAIGEKENLVSSPGGSDVSTYLDLGAGLFGKEEANFTVEFWVRFPAIYNDGKLLAIGMKDDNQTEVYINILGQVTARKRDPVTGRTDFGTCESIQMSDGTTGEITKAGVLYHYSVVFVRRTDGRYDVTFRRKLATGETYGRVVVISKTSFSPAVCQDSFCFAATPAHAGEPSRILDLDEVRIWKSALSDAQLTKNAQLGPDTLPLLNLGDTTGPLSVAAGAALDLGGNTISYGSLTGAGTVSNGTLALTDTLETQGLTVGANGVLDLTKATVVCPDVGASDVFQLASAADGGRIVGPAKAAVLPKGYVLRVKASGVSAVKQGLAILVL